MCDQLHVKSGNTNLLLSGELGSLRQRPLSIPAHDPMILSSGGTQQRDLPDFSLPHFMTGEKKPLRGADLPSDLTLCRSAVVVLVRDAPLIPRRHTGRDVVVPRRYWQPVAIAILQVGYILQANGGKVWPSCVACINHE